MTGTEGFILDVLGLLVGAPVLGFVIAEIMSFFSNRQTSQTFTEIARNMAETTTTGVEAIQNTTQLGVNAILNMSIMKDVNDLAEKKVDVQINNKNQNVQGAK